MTLTLDAPVTTINLDAFERLLDDDVTCDLFREPCVMPAMWGWRCPKCNHAVRACNIHRAEQDRIIVQTGGKITCPSCESHAPTPLAWWML